MSNFQAAAGVVIKVIRKFANPRTVKILEKKFTPRNFMSGVKSALRNSGDPHVTIESIYKGDKAWSQIKHLYRTKNVIEIESNAFLNYWYPNETMEMILEIVNSIKPIRKIANYFVEKS